MPVAVHATAVLQSLKYFLSGSLQEKSLQKPDLENLNQFNH